MHATRVHVCNFLLYPDYCWHTFLAHARQHLMLFFFFLQIHTFHVFCTIMPQPTRGPSPVKHEKGWRAGGRRSATPPVWICSAEIQTEAPVALGSVHFLSQAKIFRRRFSRLFSFASYLTRKKIKRYADRFWLQMAKMFCSWRNRHAPSVFDTSSLRNNCGEGKTTVCLLTHPGGNLPPAPLMLSMHHH